MLPERDAQVQAIFNALEAESVAVFSSGAISPDDPRTIYHFTDCDGLIGILQSKSIRLSLVTALNDLSEIKIGLSRVRTLLSSGAIATPNLPADLIIEILEETKSAIPALAYETR